MTSAEPTETSPLLSKPATNYLEAGDAPNGPLPTSTEDHPSAINEHANGSTKDSQGSDPERQDGVDTDRIHQYEGMPEVKQRLKYIVPAIAVGVSSSFIDSEKIDFDSSTRSFSQLVIKPSLCRATARSGAS